MPRILVLNPNSSTSITESISDCISVLRQTTAHVIQCSEIAAAPIGIESDADVAEVTPMVADMARADGAEAIVVACFSDPGVGETRVALPGRPVIGIAEAAYCGALQLGDRFGVISLGSASIARHAAHLDRLAIRARLAGDRDISMSVAEGNRPESFAVIHAAAERLRDEDGASVIILGCAGMGRHRAALQQALGLPVIDPVQAAVAAAISALDLEYHAFGKIGA
ncbi:aspartate/glutamate racemase family protein [Marinovum sp. 2_MG-2023]|uniref:aspartate/glutamate racemase family protein n=1 Tax=unclassified Marinovum TaxID=2647166 RepID=UPI0026E27AD9|nr:MULTISPECIES: aspartate/glutamate racemase family protein [unclassified Marinovum]MDO6732623.1 aspartate/glutamate racemase family protein [Marinovum sp. 2_MG-2023]MDO6781922.1 aspartate/glutamate racemase family protein [Marinovum sp. 1_MG-2023]